MTRTKYDKDDSLDEKIYIRDPNVWWYIDPTGKIIQVKVDSWDGSLHHVDETGYRLSDDPTKWFSSYQTMYAFKHGGSTYIKRDEETKKKTYLQQPRRVFMNKVIDSGHGGKINRIYKIEYPQQMNKKTVYLFKEYPVVQDCIQLRNAIPEQSQDE